MNEIKKYFEYLSNLAKYHYQEPHRHYHNWEHVEEMFLIAEEKGMELSLSQKLAILFHDAIYIPGSKYNEEASADLLVTYAAMVKGPLSGEIRDIVMEAHQIILDTKHHNHNICHDSSHTVLDLDLYRLSLSSEEFQAHSHNIRKEYCQFVDMEFRKGNVEFLKKMLKHERIFWNQELFNEEKARENMLTQLNIFSILR